VTTTASRERLLGQWQRIETLVIGGIVVIAFGIFLYGSFARVFIPALAIDYAEEVTSSLIVWATLLSGGTLASRRGHLAAAIVPQLLSPHARARLRIAVDVLVFAFSVLMLWFGIEAVLFAHGLDERSASTLQVPQAWALYLALPVGMLLIAVRVALLLLPGKPVRDA
jgi:TRAP-type C4-dicarboxylate transport system permease small subunit